VNGDTRYRPMEPARSFLGKVRGAARRAREMMALYENWPLAAADRMRLLPAGRPVAYRIRRGHRDAARLVATTGCWDVRLLNEIWAYEGYLRHLPSEVRGRRDVTVVDVGANRGFFCVYAASKLDVGRLIPVEPDPLNASILELNLTLNGLAPRATVHRCAVTPEPVESITLYQAHLPGLHTTVPRALAREHGLDEARYQGGETEVLATTLEELIRPLLREGRRIEVLKIDTEGSELEMLRRLPVDVLQHVDYIVAETEYQRDAELITKLRDIGMSVVDVPPMLYAVRRPSEVPQIP
jgi:FkbM family methyltransferase